MEDFSCSMPTSTPEAEAALENVRTIAVVGLSPDPTHYSHSVARFLQARGYTVIPVNPSLKDFYGSPAYPSLLDYGRPVDVVDIFRKPAAVPEIVDQAIRLGSRVIWMQEDVSHDQAAQRAEAAGLRVVQNRCIRKVLLHLD